MAYQASPRSISLTTANGATNWLKLSRGRNRVIVSKAGAAWAETITLEYTKDETPTGSSVTIPVKDAVGEVSITENDAIDILGPGSVRAQISGATTGTITIENHHVTANG